MGTSIVLMVPSGKLRKTLPAALVKRRQPGRPHYIPEWAREHGYEGQTDLIEALGDVDKSTVSRWYSEKNPSSPNKAMAARLAKLFGHPEELDCIFRPPGDAWWRDFSKGRPDDEIERIKQTLVAAFGKGGSK